MNLIEIWDNLIDISSYNSSLQVFLPPEKFYKSMFPALLDQL